MLKYICFFCAFIPTVYSRVPIFNHLQNQEELFNTNIRDIVQDSEGYMWLGTSSGLFSYDGYKFKKAKLAINGSDDIIVNTLFLDQRGCLWIGFSKSGLYKLDNDKFVKFDFDNTNDLKQLSIIDMQEDKQGNLWVATDQGLKYISHSQDLSDTIDKKFQPFKNVSISAIHIFENAQLLVATKGFFSLLNLDNPQLIKTQKLTNQDIIIHDFYIDKTNHLWIANSQGMLKYNLDNFSFSDSPIMELTNRIMKIIEYQDTLWLATIGNGLIRIKLESNKVSILTHEKNNSLSLMEDNIFSIFVSKNNILWVGGFYKGVDTLSFETLKFGYESNNHGSLDCSKENVIQSGYIDTEQTIWLGTVNGLIKYDKSKKCEFIDIKLNKSVTMIRSLVERNNKIWVLTNTNIVVFDKFANEIEVIDMNLPDNSLFITKSETGFYIGTLTGLFEYFPTKNMVSPVISKNNLINKAIFNSFYTDLDGTDYFATSNGIASINENNSLNEIKYVNDKLNSKHITAILKKNDKFYLGVKNKGLISINKSGEVSVLVPGKIDINSILADQEFLWLGSNRGLIRFNINNNFFHTFTASDGTNNQVYNSNASFSDGKFLYFGGQNGLIKFNPEQIKLQKFNSNIVLTSLLLLNKKIENNQITETGFYLDKPINKISEIEIGYKDYIVSLEFATLDYADSMRNQYAYRLKGLYEDWVYVDANNRQATFTNLKPGDYTFQVKASNKDGVWSKTPKELKIIVHPAPWLSPWAYFSYFVIIVLSIWAFIRYKTIASRKRAQQLEVTVKERTHEVNLQKKMVESLLDHKNEVLANITHEFKTPLALILGPTDQLVNEPELSVHSDKLSMIQRNAKRLMLMVGQILKLSQTELNKEVIREAQAVQPILTMLYESFKPLANDKNIDIILKNQIQANVYATAECLEIVIGNLISNALKFTNTGGKITISTELIDKHISISIRDTGTGIEKKDLEKIFKRFTRLDTHKRVQGTGIGLFVVKEITQANNGQVAVNSQWGKGSEFILTFPISDIDAIEELSPVMVDQLVNQLVDNTANELAIDCSVNTTKGEIAQSNTNSTTVLIIEDNLDMQTHIGNVLKNRFNCIFADRGRTGIALALKEVPDVVICDVMMPGMDGYQVTRILRHDSRTSHIPIILLTALNTKESRIKGWRENIDIYVTKPFDSTELNAQLDNILTIRKMLQQKTHKAIKNNNSLEELDLPLQDLKFIKKFKTVIEKYYANEYFQKADLASKMAISERQLHRKVKALIDENPMDMLRDYRLEKAAIKLKNGFQVGLVSDECGFSSVSYFGSCFKKKYGVTPKKYQLLK
ncbi:MAG: ATP-binding protein [Proteobacteria bacterium]|nr:ATP-binding protein [Pseudomonadota bacterium]